MQRSTHRAPSRTPRRAFSRRVWATAGSLGAVLATLLGVSPGALAGPKPGAAPAAASKAPVSPTLVVIIDGTDSAKPVAGLGPKLPEPWKVGDDAPIRKALTAAGQRNPNASLANPTLKALVVKKTRAAASAAGVGAVVFVRVAKRNGANTATIVMVNAANNDVVEATVEVPPADDHASVLSVISPALEHLVPKPPPHEPEPPVATKEAPPPPTDHKEPPPPEVEDNKEPTKLGGPDRSIVILSAGGGIASRFFRYNDGLSPQLRTYDLGASPNLVVAAELYPFAHGSTTVLKNLGIGGGVQHALALSSETSGGTKVSTSWLRVEGELRARFAFGEEGRFILGLHTGIVDERFAFTGGGAALAGSLPDVSYIFWRLGVDLRLRAGPIALLAGGSFLPAIGGGQVADRFRDTSFSAVELGGGVALPLARVFEVRGTVGYTRVFYSFNPKVGDAYVAGGALDNLIRAQILATLLL